MAVINSRQRQTNGKLWLGILFLSLLLIASITGIYWLEHDPYYMEGMRVVENEDGGTDLSSKPFPISSENWFGTDKFGRDLFSRIIIGAKVTILLVFALTVAKMLIALPLGLLAGAGAKFIGRFVENFSFVFSGFPALFAALFIFGMTDLNDFSLTQRLLFMVSVIAVLEWGRIALVVKGRTEQIIKEPYIEGAKVLGRSRIGIVFHHVLRVIAPDTVVLLFNECARSLMFIGQLAVFGIYMLETITVDNNPLPDERTSFIPEWGSALGESRNFIFSNPGVTFIIALVIVLTIISFNLLAEGLRDRLAHPLPKERGSLLFLRSLKPTHKVVVASISVILLVPIVLSIKSESVTTISHNLSAEDYLVETSEQWKEIGLNPVNNDFMSVDILKETIVDEDKSLVSISVNVKEHDFNIGIDAIHPFYDGTFGTGEITAPTIKAKPIDNMRMWLRLIREVDNGTYDGKVLIVEDKPENANYYFNFSELIYTSLVQADVKGIIYITNSEGANKKFLKGDQPYQSKSHLNAIPHDVNKFFPVLIWEKESDLLLESKQVYVKYDTKDIEQESITLQAVLEDSKELKGPVILYTDYSKSYESLSVMKDVVKLIKNSREIGRDTYFVTVDGTRNRSISDWLVQNHKIAQRNPIIMKINFGEPTKELKGGIGVNLEANTSNFVGVMPLENAKQAVSHSAWKSDMIPYIGTEASVSSEYKHITFTSNHRNLAEFICKVIKKIA